MRRRILFRGVLLLAVLLAGRGGGSTATTEAATQTRADFLKLLSRPQPPLAPAPGQVTETGDLRVERVDFLSEIGAHGPERVPTILVQRTGPSRRRPVVISLHGTGGTKESQLPLLQDLARRGFLAVSIDGRHHGARIPAGKGKEAYEQAILRAWQSGGQHPFLYDTVWDVMRLLDYLETRGDVDPRRVGLIGFSKGGMEGYLAAAADPRISVLVPCIGVQSFRWALEHDSWQSRVGTFQTAIDAAAREAGHSKIDAAFVRRFYDRVVPGIYGRFDGPAMLPLIAPRPLFVIVGDTDQRTPLPGVHECIAAARLAYRASGSEEKLSLLIQPQTAHKVTPEAQQAAVAWFEKWLRP